MPEPRALLRSGLTALLAYVALELAWGVLARPFVLVFRFLLELAFLFLGGGNRIELAEPDSASGASADTLLVVTAADPTDSWGVLCSSHGALYVPLAVFLSLWVAMPLSPARRWKGLLVGLVALYAYACFRLGIAAAFAFSIHECAFPETHSRLLRNPRAESLLGMLNGKVLADLVLGRLAPVLIWLVACVRWPTSARMIPAPRASA